MRGKNDAAIAVGKLKFREDCVVEELTVFAPWVENPRSFFVFSEKFWKVGIASKPKACLLVKIASFILSGR